LFDDTKRDYRGVLVTGPLVAVVLISHSALLAEGAAELVTQMSAGLTPIAHAGGTDDGRLGTSMELLEKAVASVASSAGVVIIPDLGSSILTTRTYLADLDDDEALQVAMVDAPFIEGAVAAVVAAAAGLPLADVVAAAEETRGQTKL
jgi:phosphoenolpyruvate---glycerone phosphotransferase subunit DhaM